MRHQAICTMIAIGLASPVAAECYGTAAYRTCTDDYGNSYSTNTWSGGSMTQGYNLGTGSSWSQSTIGNYTSGYDSEGRSWSRTDTSTGYFGNDANGNFYSCIRTLSGQTICN